MRWGAIVSEAWRNIASGAALAGPLAALMGTLCAVVIGFAAADVRGIAERAAEFRGSGAAVLILQAPGAIDPGACEALGGTPGVRAGALRRAPNDVAAAALPRSSIPTFEVTPGLVGMLDVAGAGAPGVLLSRAVADTVGAGGLTAARGPVTVGGVYEYPRDGRRADLEFAVLAPTTSGEPFDECWAATWPQQPDLETLVRTSLVPIESTEVAVTQLNSTHGAVFDGAALFEQRPTRWLPALLALAGGVTAYLAARVRKLELASARHSGVTLADQWITVALESVAWAVAAAVVAAPVICAFVARAAAVDRGSYLSLGVSSWALACAGGLVGATAAVLLGGERHLFDHAKARR